MVTYLDFSAIEAKCHCEDGAIESRHDGVCVFLSLRGAFYATKQSQVAFHYGDFKDYMRQIIFDFDGTLVDSFNTAIEIFNLLSDEFNYRKIESAEIIDLKHLTSHELIKHLRIPLYQIPSILKRARKLFYNKLLTLSPVENISDLLDQLAKENMTLGILTSNAAKNVIEWLKYNNLYHLFRFVHIESSYFGKQRILKKIIKLYKFDKSQTVYIGDETRDIEAAKLAEINSIAVTWGFNSEQILIQQQPNFIARNPQDLLTMLIKKSELFNETF